jgi:Fe-S cluster assembly iron-binding protein IscA
MSHDLVLDEPRPDDDLFDFGPIHVVVDRGSQLYLDDTVTIDYHEEKGGYELKSPGQIIPGVFFL